MDTMVIDNAAWNSDCTEASNSGSGKALYAFTTSRCMRICATRNESEAYSCALSRTLQAVVR